MMIVFSARAVMFFPPNLIFGFISRHTYGTLTNRVPSIGVSYITLFICLASSSKSSPQCLSFRSFGGFSLFALLPLGGAISSLKTQFKRRHFVHPPCYCYFGSWIDNHARYVRLYYIYDISLDRLGLEYFLLLLVSRQSLAKCPVFPQL